MNVENSIYIAIAGIICFFLGWFTNHRGKKDRDAHIQELEYDLLVKQNIINSNNEAINRLRQENEKLKKKIKTLKSGQDEE